MQATRELGLALTAPSALPVKKAFIPFIYKFYDYY